MADDIGSELKLLQQEIIVWVAPCICLVLCEKIEPLGDMLFGVHNSGSENSHF